MNHVSIWISGTGYSIHGGLSSTFHRKWLKVRISCSRRLKVQEFYLGKVMIQIKTSEKGLKSEYPVKWRLKVWISCPQDPHWNLIHHRNVQYCWFVKRFSLHLLLDFWKLSQNLQKIFSRRTKIFSVKRKKSKLFSFQMKIKNPGWTASVHESGVIHC